MTDDQEEAMAMGMARCITDAVAHGDTILASITAVIGAPPDTGIPRCELQIQTRKMIPDRQVLEALRDAVEICIARTEG